MKKKNFYSPPNPQPLVLSHCGKTDNIYPYWLTGRGKTSNLPCCSASIDLQTWALLVSRLCNTLTSQSLKLALSQTIWSGIFDNLRRRVHIRVMLILLQLQDHWQQRDETRIHYLLLSLNLILPSSDFERSWPGKSSLLRFKWKKIPELMSAWISWKLKKNMILRKHFVSESSIDSVKFYKFSASLTPFAHTFSIVLCHFPHFSLMSPLSLMSRVEYLKTTEQIIYN